MKEVKSQQADSYTLKRLDILNRGRKKMYVPGKNPEADKIFAICKDIKLPNAISLFYLQ